MCNDRVQVILSSQEESSVPREKWTSSRWGASPSWYYSSPRSAQSVHPEIRCVSIQYWISRQTTNTHTAELNGDRGATKESQGQSSKGSGPAEKKKVLKIRAFYSSLAAPACDEQKEFGGRKRVESSPATPATAALYRRVFLGSARLEPQWKRVTRAGAKEQTERNVCHRAIFRAARTVLANCFQLTHFMSVTGVRALLHGHWFRARTLETLSRAKIRQWCVHAAAAGSPWIDATHLYIYACNVLFRRPWFPGRCQLRAHCNVLAVLAVQADDEGRVLFINFALGNFAICFRVNHFYDVYFASRTFASWCFLFVRVYISNLMETAFRY